MRIPGYNVTASFFVPVPKTDFAAQAKAATEIAAAVQTGKLTEELLALATGFEIKAKYGSAEGEAK